MIPPVPFSRSLHPTAMRDPPRFFPLTPLKTTGHSVVSSLRSLPLFPTHTFKGGKFTSPQGGPA